jgi:hypothetical protein
MMNHLSIAAVLSIVLFSSSVRAESKVAAAPLPSVAVLDLTFTPAEEELAVNAADSLNAELIASKKYTVVERRKIAHVMKEQALGMTGAISEETAIKVGALVGAKLLVVGRLSRIGDIFRLDARILDAESAGVVTAAHADFKDRTKVDLAVREVVRGFIGGAGSAAATTKTDGKGGTSTAAVSAPDIIVDPSKARDAAADIAKQIAAKFRAVKGKLDAVDEAGRGRFTPNGQFVFPGLRLKVSGLDEMTGDKGMKGYMLVQDADSSSVSGRTTSTTSPIAAGDEVASMPYMGKVHGASSDATKALSAAINGLTQFSESKDATPLEVEYDLKGTAVGDRHLTVRVLDPQANILGTFETTITL